MMLFHEHLDRRSAGIWSHRADAGTLATLHERYSFNKSTGFGVGERYECQLVEVEASNASTSTARAEPNHGQELAVQIQGVSRSRSWSC